MSMYPWLDFSRTVNLSDLPNLDKFMAYKEGIIENRILYDTSINEKNNDILYSNQTNYIYIAVIILVVIIILFLMIKEWK